MKNILLFPFLVVFWFILFLLLWSLSVAVLGRGVSYEFILGHSVLFSFVFSYHTLKGTFSH